MTYTKAMVIPYRTSELAHGSKVKVLKKVKYVSFPCQKAISSTYIEQCGKNIGSYCCIYLQNQLAMMESKTRVRRELIVEELVQNAVNEYYTE